MDVDHPQPQPRHVANCTRRQNKGHCGQHPRGHRETHIINNLCIFNESPNRLLMENEYGSRKKWWKISRVQRSMNCRVLVRALRAVSKNASSFRHDLNLVHVFHETHRKRTARTSFLHAKRTWILVALVSTSALLTSTDAPIADLLPPRQMNEDDPGREIEMMPAKRLRADTDTERLQHRRDVRLRLATFSLRVHCHWLWLR